MALPLMKDCECLGSAVTIERSFCNRFNVQEETELLATEKDSP
jgi:hypothetical protein